MKPHTFTGEPVYDRMRFGIWLKIIRPLNVKLVDFVSFPESKYSPGTGNGCVLGPFLGDAFHCLYQIRNDGFL